MSAAVKPVQEAAIRQYAQQLRLPTLGAQFARLAELAVKERQSHLTYVEALLEAELEERERRAVVRRIQEARFPAVKTLEEFDFQCAPHIPAALVRNLSEGGYLARKEPIIFLGETGTGKTHLATGLAVAACRQRKRVRFTTAAEMVTELIEAQQTGTGRKQWRPSPETGKERRALDQPNEARRPPGQACPGKAYGGRSNEGA